jgi:hypothetical protein
MFPIHCEKGLRQGDGLLYVRKFDEMERVRTDGPAGSTEAGTVEGQIAFYKAGELAFKPSAPDFSIAARAEP